MAIVYKKTIESEIKSIEEATKFLEASIARVKQLELGAPSSKRCELLALALKELIIGVKFLAAFLSVKFNEPQIKQLPNYGGYRRALISELKIAMSVSKAIIERTKVKWPEEGRPLPLTWGVQDLNRVVKDMRGFLKLLREQLGFNPPEKQKELLLEELLELYGLFRALIVGFRCQASVLANRLMEECPAIYDSLMRSIESEIAQLMRIIGLYV